MRMGTAANRTASMLAEGQQYAIADGGQHGQSLANTRNTQAGSDQVGIGVGMGIALNRH